MKKVKFFVSVTGGYQVIDFDNEYYKTCPLRVFRTEEGQLDFISKSSKITSLSVREVFARLIVTQTDSVLDISIDPVFKGGIMFPFRLKVIITHFEKYGKEIRVSFCE